MSAARVAFVACSYDTAFEPIGDQVRAKIAQLDAAFDDWSVWLVDDVGDGFGEAVRAAYSEFPALLAEGRLQLAPLRSAHPRRGGLKGRALLDGMQAALEAGADVVVAMNLNLKVDPALARAGVADILSGAYDAAVGTRAAADGGRASGAGRLGRLKSRAYNLLARALLPPLRTYRDTNAPLKVFSARAARILLSEARIPRVSMDCEWLLILHMRGLRVSRFPIAWAQRAGSRPPWHLVPTFVLDVLRLRSRLSSRESLWRHLLVPEHPGKRRRLDRSWQSLPPRLQRGDQTQGQQLLGCAATYNVLERCNFSCTACYLSNTANAVPPLPFEEVKAQLDAIREHLGPWGNTQITAGEVTLMPVEDLIRIVRYCNQIQLSAMVMTHGETFRDDPTYLERLVVEGGLQKVAIHIDTTQRGRRGLKTTDREADIHWLRDAFADLVRETRRKTGQPLAAAHTFTVTEDNIDQVPEVVRWFTRNADAFRMLSFQPTAAVGRTRTGALAGRESMRRRLWDGVRAGAGRPLNERQFIFGHERCTSLNLAFAVTYAGRTELLEVIREHPVDRRFMRLLLESRLAGFSPDGVSIPQATAQVLGRVLRQPTLLGAFAAFGAYRAYTDRAWLAAFASAALRGAAWSIHPIALVVHHFMSADELETDEGRARLDACVFRLPVNGEMVSMCRMNGTDLRRRLNEEATTRLRRASLSANS